MPTIGADEPTTAPVVAPAKILLPKLIPNFVVVFAAIFLAPYCIVCRCFMIESTPIPTPVSNITSPIALSLDLFSAFL